MSPQPTPKRRATAAPQTYSLKEVAAQVGVDLAPELAAGDIAVVALNPWDKPDRPEVKLLPLPYPVLFSGLTTSDSHEWSELVEGSLGQPGLFGPPMPIIYVLDKAGVIVRAQWGYNKADVRSSLGLL